MSRAATKAKTRKLKELSISDIAGLRAMADPTRLHILIELGDQPRTVKEVALTIGVRPTRLYYHFKILERAGLIRVAGRRMVSGIEERSYESVAESTTIAPEAIASGVRSGVVGALMNMIGAELELALLSGPVTVGDPESAVPMLSLSSLSLTPEQVEELQNRLIALNAEFGDGGEPAPEKRRYHTMLATYLAPSEVRR